ncbi:MAG: hypothetical protein ACRDE2_10550, partial [Chitinophagaceae bacterium]
MISTKNSKNSCRPKGVEEPLKKNSHRRPACRQAGMPFFCIRDNDDCYFLSHSRIQMFQIFLSTRDPKNMEKLDSAKLEVCD